MSREGVDVSGSPLIIYLKSKLRKHAENSKKRNEEKGKYTLTSPLRCP